MPVPAKLVTLAGLLMKEESTYGTFAPPSASTDGFLLQYDDRNVGALASVEWAFDGDLGPSVASGAPTKRAAPAGRSWRAQLPFRMKGFGSAYSGSNTPSGHRALKACGFDATVTTTGGSEKWDYSPTAEGTTFTSVSIEGYARGEKWPAAGVIGTISCTFDNQAPPKWMMDARGISNALPTDVSVPAITYPSFSVLPPLASSVTVTIGSYTTNAIVLSGSFTYNRGIENPRVPISGNHLGFVPSGRGARLMFVIEQSAFVGSPFHTSAGIDPYALREAATSIAVSAQFQPTVQYNRYKISLPTAQLATVTPQNNGPVATVALEFVGHGSTPATNDDVLITFD